MLRKLMRKYLKVIFVIFTIFTLNALLFLKCAYDINALTGNNKTTSYVGMVKINANGKLVTLGSGDKYAKDDEKPPMKVMFTYDFYIDTVEVTAATALPYIGFRCAAGKIPDCNGITIDSTLPEPPQLIVKSPLHFATTTNVKLVFVNRKNDKRILCYIDYSENQPKIHEFRDIQNVFHPTISPDGQYVAFCTQSEGFGANSTIIIRRLDPEGSGLVILNDDPAFIPRWWIDTVSDDTVLIYTNSTTLNSQEHWNSTKTKKIAIKGGIPADGLPEIICNEGSYHGGMTVDGEFLVTGYQFLKVRNNCTNLMSIMFTGPTNGKQVGDTSQVCNVSVVQNSTKHEVVFLDFGYRETSIIVGRPYGVHEILFSMDLSENTIKWYKPPDGFIKWNYPECSNQSPIVAAAVTDNSGRHPAVCVLNLVNQNIVELVSGEDLLYPYIWLRDSVKSDTTILSIDSLGRWSYTNK